jgi:ABC-2 type transport system ATP-binding protein
VDGQAARNIDPRRRRGREDTVMLEYRNFSKTYKGGKRAVDGLTLTISAGDIYGFIGHNGAGKTTSLRAAAGLLDFTEGEILVDGKSIKTDPMACKQAMAYVPDNPDLYDYLTGIQYLRFIADVYRLDGATRNDRIERYSSAFEIDKNLGDAIASYSHGMKQKLALTAALIHQPRLLILDEPFVGLDPIAVHTFKGFMQEMCADGGAVFFSTHVLDVAEKLCDKIAIIRQGKLIANGPTAAVRGDASLESAFLELENQKDGAL